MSDVKNGDVELGKEATLKNNKKLIAIVAGAVVAVIALILIIAGLVGGNYKKPIKNYYKAIQKQNTKTYLSAYPKFARENMEENADKVLEEELKDYEKSYGDKVKFDIKFISKIKLSKDKLSKKEEALKKAYPDDKIKVTAGYEVCYKIKVKGSDEKEEYFDKNYIYKINGKWCFSPSTYVSSSYDYTDLYKDLLK